MVGSGQQLWWSKCAQMDQLLPITASMGGACWASRVACHVRDGEKVGGLPLLKMLRDGSIMVQTWMICWLDRRSVLLDSPSKRKADVKYSRNEVATSLAKDASPLGKTPRIPSVEKTQLRAVPSSPARVKHLVGANSTKVGGMRGVRGVLP
ncbi:unnamed protein product [Prunus armeniaca]